MSFAWLPRCERNTNGPINNKRASANWCEIENSERHKTRNTKHETPLETYPAIGNPWIEIISCDKIINLWNFIRRLLLHDWIGVMHPNITHNAYIYTGAHTRTHSRSCTFHLFYSGPLRMDSGLPDWWKSFDWTNRRISWADENGTCNASPGRLSIFFSCFQTAHGPLGKLRGGVFPNGAILQIGDRQREKHAAGIAGNGWHLILASMALPKTLRKF